MQANPDMYPDHPRFKERYGMSRSRFYDYKKLRDSEALQVRGDTVRTASKPNG